MSSPRAGCARLLSLPFANEIVLPLVLLNCRFHHVPTETEVANRGGCVHAPGGEYEYKAGPVWSVYKVSGGVTS